MESRSSSIGLEGKLAKESLRRKVREVLAWRTQLAQLCNHDTTAMLEQKPSSFRISIKPDPSIHPTWQRKSFTKAKLAKFTSRVPNTTRSTFTRRPRDPRPSPGQATLTQLAPPLSRRNNLLSLLSRALDQAQTASSVIRFITEHASLLRGSFSGESEQQLRATWPRLG